MKLHSFTFNGGATGAIALALSLSCHGACNAQPKERNGSAQCNAENAQSLVGQQLTSELLETARTLSGSKVVRRLAPDSVPTMEFRRDRINVSGMRTAPSPTSSAVNTSFFAVTYAARSVKFATATVAALFSWSL